MPRAPEAPDRTSRPLTAGRKAVFALACIGAGFLPVSVGYLSGDVVRLACGGAVAAALLALALLAKRHDRMRPYWEIPLAFFGMALFIVIDRVEPNFLATQVLHSPPVPGNPLASTIAGTVVVELNELLLTVLVVLLVLWISGTSLASVYVRWGRFGKSYVIGIIALVAFYALTFRILSHSRFIPVHGTVDFSRYLALTPALLAAVAANGFLEELMFRGLLMSKLNTAFAPLPATVIQAAIFATWHVGVTYTASTLVFVVLFVLPLGLICGWLTRSSGSIIPGSLLHAGADLPIYLGFLSAVS